MEKIKLVKKDELKNEIDNRILNNEMRYYIYDITKSILNDGKINMDNITKRVEKYFKEKIENNKYELCCYYEKNDCIGTEYNIVFWKSNYITNRYMEFSEKITLKYVWGADDIKDISIDTINKNLEYIGNQLKYYNSILENIDNIIDENNKIYNDFMEFSKKYSSENNNILWILNK